MVTKRRRNSKTDKNDKLYAVARKELIGAVIYTFIFTLCSLAAVLADSDKDKVYYLSVASFGVASFIFAYISVLKERKNGLLYGILYTLPLNLAIIFVSLILCSFKADLHLLISAAVLLITSALGGILSVNSRIKR